MGFTRFRPCIDIHEGKIKQIVGSTLTNPSQKLIENFVTEKPASYFAKMYKDESLIGGHVIMLDNKEETLQQAREALQTYPKGLQVGGGINDATAAEWIEKGASHVILTNFLFDNDTLNIGHIEKVIQRVGREQIVLDLSCRKKNGNYYVVKDKWQRFTNLEVNKETIQKLENYCSEFLIHGVDAEGTQSGIEKELIAKLGSWVSIPTTYAGGVKKYSDIDLVRELGKGKIDLTIGSALNIFGGALEYKKVIELFKKNKG